ncbi:hypothetical protein [Anaeromicropila herbilytica]|uniref:Flp pilus assembly protein TadB n=1 Tax=Anaeromicropila herbilytica TaxID=2785025 RepID=A0A7R7EIS7_9FIRM|nr:hypothetical protein [Anaeromicropila herbilytica]BCN29533.1 hypothetical protein bsdtb5_08280 [Anaeromicropila herbilytica]
MIGLFKVTSFILLLLGCFILFQIDVLEFIQDIGTLFRSKKCLRDRILEASGKKKKNSLMILIEDALHTLKTSGKEEDFSKICVLSLSLSVGGLLFGFTISNYYLAPVLCVGMCMLPFLYVKYLGIRLQKQINNELETALSIVTSSYIRCEDIITAISENKEYINPPVKEIFDQFVLEANLLNPDIKKLLSDMKGRIDNEVFKEWCDAIISCQEDGALKSTLLPIVKKLSNIRLVSVRLDALLYQPVKEYITMVLLLICNIPLMYFINRTWFEILIFHTSGKLVLTMCAIVIFISALGVVKISKPIEYKR